MNIVATLVIFAIMIHMTPHSTAAQAPRTLPPPPDTIVRQVLAVIESGDAGARSVLIGRAFTPRARSADSARIDRFLRLLHEQGAPYTVRGIERSARHALVTLGSARTRRAATLMISTDRADSTGLGNVDILEAHPAVLDSVPWPATRPVRNADVARIIDTNVSRLAKEDAFAGVMYVAARDSIIYARAFGLANREDSIPNTVGTRFALASMGKMFTATAVLRLVEQGKLRLDDTLATVLPLYPNAERARRITIRHLLEHTSGMGDQWSTPRRPVAGLTGALGTVAAVAHAALLFEPGARWSYSNEGYNVLAAVIEQVSGRSYKAFVREEVLLRAGMTNTVQESGSDDIIPRRAVGYRPPDGDLLGALPPRANWSFIVGSTAGGAGGGYSTAADLARFARAMREGRLLGAALRDSMWTGRWPIPGFADERYGLGSFVRRVGERVSVGHGGGGTGSGIDTGFRYFTDGSYTVVVLTNIDPPTATRVTAAIVNLLGAPLAPAPQASR